MPTPTGSGSPGPAGKAARVLLCDDAVAFSALFRRWMTMCGLDMVAQAQTEAEALALAKEHLPDVIVVDHLLRDVTSEGLAPRLREAAPDARLLLISGMPDDRLAEIARTAGADGYVSKAASSQAFCEAVLALVDQPSA